MPRSPGKIRHRRSENVGVSHRLVVTLWEHNIYLIYAPNRATIEPTGTLGCLGDTGRIPDSYAQQNYLVVLLTITYDIST